MRIFALMSMKMGAVCVTALALMGAGSATTLVAADPDCHIPITCIPDMGKKIGNSVYLLCEVDTITVSKDLLDNPIPPYQEPVPAWNPDPDSKDPDGGKPKGHCAHWWEKNLADPKVPPIQRGECGGQGIDQCKHGA